MDEAVVRAPGRRGARSLIVAATAVVTGGVLLLTGALDKKSPVNLDPRESVTSAPATTDPGASVMINYLREMKAWNDCVTVDTTGASCGTAPAQPDDPQLNAYLATVLDWNKCAAPMLRRSGMQTAIAACGAQPASPIGG